HSGGQPLPAAVSRPPRCGRLGPDAFEPVEHRFPDKSAGSALLRAVRANGPRRVAAGIHRDLPRTGPQAEVEPHLTLSCLHRPRCSHRVREPRLLECPRCAVPPRTTSVRGRRLIVPKLPVLDSTVNALLNPKTRHTRDIRHFVYGYVTAPDQCCSN